MSENLTANWHVGKPTLFGILAQASEGLALKFPRLWKCLVDAVR